MNMNRTQIGLAIGGIVLAILVMFLPKHLHFDMAQGDQSSYLDLRVPLLTQLFLLFAVAALTTLAMWGSRTRA